MCWMCDRKYYSDQAWTATGLDIHVSGLGKMTTAFATDGIGDVGGDNLSPALLVITSDTAGDGIGVAPGNPVLAVGTFAAPVAHTISTLDIPGDQDYYQVTLEAGRDYQIGMYAYVGGPSGVPLSDPYIEILTANGTTEGFEVVTADGGAMSPQNNVNSGLDVLLTFQPTVTGTYYINARAFGNAGGPNGDEIGDYELFVDDMTDDPTIYRPYYSVDSPLYSIDWGTQVNRVNQSVRNPDGDEGTRDNGNPQGTVPATNPNLVPGKNVITIYFAREGDVFVSEDPLNPGLPPALVSVGTEEWEKETVWTALGEFSKVADIVYVEVDSREEADFIFTTYSGTPGPGISLLGSMSPPDYYDEGLAQFNSGDYRWTEQNLQQGGFSYVTLIHEFGHGHGLAHPHDSGGHSGEMREVEGIVDTPAGEVPDPTGVWPNYTLGQHNLNQAVYTMMSYMDGWQTSPYGNAPTDVGYGYLGGLMAFDIAVIQDKYGVNEEWATGDDTYTLKDVNAAGTFYSSIWDGGGTDQIVYSGARNASIDLRQATLQYDPGGGGYVSYAHGIFGGFTIANGVTIENAASGSGNDTLIGNSANNILNGGGGNDIINLSFGGADTAIGGDGADAFVFGAALTAADAAFGGAGQDVVALQGVYNVTLGNNALNGVETLSLLPRTDTRFGGSTTTLNKYVITTVDANVVAGGTLVVNAAQLGLREDFTLYGHTETNGGFFIYGGKGVDNLHGGAMVDIFFFGDERRWWAGDKVDGNGGNDILILRGNYTGANKVVFAAGSLADVETVTLNATADTRYAAPGLNFGYDVTAHDANLALGKTMTFNGAQLGASEALTFNGAAETNGHFRLFGGASEDSLTGGAGNDLLYGGGRGDYLRGGNGADTYQYGPSADSTGLDYDTIEGFDYRVDKIDMAFAVSATEIVNGGSLSAGSLETDLAAALDTVLDPGSAAVFTPNAGDLAGKTFLVVDGNSDGAYASGHDYLIELLNPVVPLAATTVFFV